jgi:hypothetical protein
MNTKQNSLEKQRTEAIRRTFQNMPLEGQILSNIYTIKLPDGTVYRTDYRNKLEHAKRLGLETNWCEDCPEAGDDFEWLYDLQHGV